MGSVISRTDYTRYDGAGNLLANRLSVYGAGGGSANYTNDYTLTLGRDEGYHVAVTDATDLPGFFEPPISRKSDLVV